jgi:hypothetical protein
MGWLWTGNYNYFTISEVSWINCQHVVFGIVRERVQLMWRQSQVTTAAAADFVWWFLQLCAAAESAINSFINLFDCATTRWMSPAHSAAVCYLFFFWFQAPPTAQLLSSFRSEEGLTHLAYMPTLDLPWEECMHELRRTHASLRKARTI